LKAHKKKNIKRYKRGSQEPGERRERKRSERRTKIQNLLLSLVVSEACTSGLLIITLGGLFACLFYELRDSC
jgi:hypothetical protein